MTVTVHIPTPLQAYAGKNATIQVQGETVGEILQQLVISHAALKKHLFTEDGQVRKFVNVYLNNEDIRYLQHVHTQVEDKDVIRIIPSIAGG
jgi:adenylyltransferase/sulfurtransferase